jgi:hypothetical protein
MLLPLIYNNLRIIDNNNSFLKYIYCSFSRHQNPKDFPGLGGSALLDTYLSMIAAADGNVAAAAAAFNFQNTPAARAAAMAAAAAAAGMIPMNGKEDR